MLSPPELSRQCAASTQSTQPLEMKHWVYFNAKCVHRSCQRICIVFLRICFLIVHFVLNYQNKREAHPMQAFYISLQTALPSGHLSIHENRPSTWYPWRGVLECSTKQFQTKFPFIIIILTLCWSL